MKTWKQALEESIQHHKDNLKMLETAKGRFRNFSEIFCFGVGKKRIFYDDASCALCIRQEYVGYDCSRCPLGKLQGSRCTLNRGAWSKLVYAKTKEEAIEAEKAMIKKLIEARKFVR